MFEVNLNNYSIRMHAGDTGEVQYAITNPDATENDKYIWTMRNGRGEIVKQNVMTVVDDNGALTGTVTFNTEDTMNLDAGTYRYDIRALIGVEGFQEVTTGNTPDGYSFTDVQDVCTPLEAMTVQIIGPVGKISQIVTDEVTVNAGT